MVSTLLFEKKTRSTVNQFMVQIKELQGRVNFVNDARQFFDPEAANSLGYPTSPVNPEVFRVLVG